MNTKLQNKIETSFTINPHTRIGVVHLTVSNLQKQLDFYQNTVGLQLHWLDGSSAGLGVGKSDLLHLTEIKGARRSRSTSGLYHFALLQPDRRELARVIGRLFTLSYPNYPTDHIITKSTYLDDPEGNNIEIYAESPDDGTMMVKNGAMVSQRADGSLSDGREAMDLNALFSHLRPEDTFDKMLSSKTRIGHVHLYVADLDETMTFYHDILGFGNMGLARQFRMGMVSAGGYHHHIGFNTWMGQGVPPPPPDALGIRYYTILLPNQIDLENMLKRLQDYGINPMSFNNGFLIRDPSQIGVHLEVGPEVK